jgi:hypothetical protein
MTNFPGTACEEFGAYSSTSPISTRLFKFLNLSPPWAARAARAKSIGALAALIAAVARAGAVGAGVGLLAFVAAWSCALETNADPKIVQMARVANVIVFFILLPFLRLARQLR